MMSSRYHTVVCAVKSRERDSNGQINGWKLKFKLLIHQPVVDKAYIPNKYSDKTDGLLRRFVTFQ